MKVRLGQKKDAKTIMEQNRALAKESEHIILTPETTLAGVNALLSDTSKGFYLIAEENKRIIGQLMITVEWSDWRNKPIWWVQSVYVQKEWRKKGVFTTLLDKVRYMGQQQGVAFLRLYVHEDNLSAIQVYHALGWHQDRYLLYHLPL